MWRVLLATLVASSSFAATIADEKHLGVASCATGVCHGKLEPQKNENVWLNEYRIWTADDRHSEAYRTLSSPESKQIAQKLGLPAAHTAKICLDCHADNVPTDKRGPKFQITDGIACEACHGGAEKWVQSHAEEGATHKDNLAKGMYPTEDPVARAELCLSCHLGTADKFATHEIMGAGHPRLSFELEAFTANQPAHYSVDEDYVARKGRIPGFNLWLTGQLEASERYLRLLKSKLYTRPGLFPEIAFYDCHSCHHAMDDIRWNAKRSAQGIRPGTMRLQDHHLLIIGAATKVLEPAEAARLGQSVGSLVKAGQTSTAEVQKAADALLQWIGARRRSWTSATYDQAKVRAVRRALAEQGGNGTLADFAAAEQVFLGVESLSLYLGDAAKIRGPLDKLYATVKDDRTFRPVQFSAAARDLLNVL
jgi:hypothetical protein